MESCLSVCPVALGGLLVGDLRPECLSVPLHGVRLWGQVLTVRIELFCVTGLPACPCLVASWWLLWILRVTLNLASGDSSFPVLPVALFVVFRGCTSRWGQAVSTCLSDGEPMTHELIFFG